MGSRVGRNQILNECLLKNRPGQFMKLNPKPFDEIYQLGNMIGMSHIGDVHEAIHKTTHQSYGVKIVDESIEINRKTIEKIKDILTVSDHPGLVKCNEYFRENNRMYLVMEKCTGGNLLELLPDSRYLEEYNASIICHRLLSVVYHLHQHKISHRSIRPEFILFQEPGNYSDVKLVFLTHAEYFTETSRFTEQVGQEMYSSPEMLNRDYNEKCDLWSVGILFYWMLSGELPFTDIEQNRENIMNFNYQFDHEVWQTISDNAKDLIKKLLCPESQRFSAYEALHHSCFSTQDVFRVPARSAVIKIFQNLASYNSQDKFRDAICGLSISVLTEYDYRHIRNLFLSLDIDGDGKLNQEEFINGLHIPFNEKANRRLIEKVMNQIDTDGNRYIEYNEFLKASIGKDVILKESNLRAVFAKIDSDGSGKLSLDEFAKTFSTNPEDRAAWAQFIQSADLNGDDEIDFEEFEAVVKRKFQD